jgi:preprotein translocase subunit SecE
MQKILQYLKDVRSEMQKVTWPTRDELTGATMLVIFLSLVISLYVGLCDQVLFRAIGFLLRTHN